MISFVPLADIDAAAVEALLDRAFGKDRHGRTAYRVRAGTAPILELSFAAVDAAGALVGTLQCWPVALACDSGEVAPMVMVGPVAVEPARQQEGIGRALMERVLAVVATSSVTGADALMLVGDPEYYGRFFGFNAERTGRWRLPGPFEPHRLLARGDKVPGCAGVLGPRVTAGA